MVKKLITMLLLLLWGTQPSWPMAIHHVSGHGPKDAAIVAGHNHSMAGGHACCPEAATRFEIQAPAGGPCDSQHRCCFASREVPVVQASSSGVGPEFDGASPGIRQFTPTSSSSSKLLDAVGPHTYQASIVVLRI